MEILSSQKKVVSLTHTRDELKTQEYIQKDIEYQQSRYQRSDDTEIREVD